MKMKILGSMSPYAHYDKACPSYYIKDKDLNLLLDCGSGSHRFFDMQKDVNGLNIIISHLHRDHYNDIYNYLYTSFVLHNQGVVTDKLQIYLPDYPKEIAQDIINEKNAFADFHLIDKDSVLQIGDAKISFCSIEHSKDVKNFATKIEKDGQIIVYSSDVSYASAQKLALFSQNADLLLCESSLLQEHGFPEICNHLTAKQAGTIAKMANVKALVLTHFWPEENLEKYKKEAESVFPNVKLAKENSIIDSNEVNNGNSILCR